MAGKRIADIPRTFFHRRIALGDPHPHATTACVTDDGTEYLYSVGRQERAAFKAWAAGVFAGGMNCKRLSGAWPNYRVVQP